MVSHGWLTIDRIRLEMVSAVERGEVGRTETKTLATFVEALGAA
jgi:hypothetical protein